VSIGRRGGGRAAGIKRRVADTRQTEQHPPGCTDEREYGDMPGAGVQCLFCGMLCGVCWVVNSAILMCKIHFQSLMHNLLEIA
jgi:hypothetical protein